MRTTVLVIISRRAVGFFIPWAGWVVIARRTAALRRATRRWTSVAVAVWIVGIAWGRGAAAIFVTRGTVVVIVVAAATVVITRRATGIATTCWGAGSVAITRTIDLLLSHCQCDRCLSGDRITHIGNAVNFDAVALKLPVIELFNGFHEVFFRLVLDETVHNVSDV